MASSVKFSRASAPNFVRCSSGKFANNTGDLAIGDRSPTPRDSLIENRWERWTAGVGGCSGSGIDWSPETLRLISIPL